MGRNYFCDDEVVVLRKNKYVKCVSNKAITYTQIFKENFIALKALNTPPKKIFKRHGFDVEMLGDSRIHNFTERMKRYSLRSEGTQDTRTTNSGRPRIKEHSDKEIIEMQNHEIAYLKQQLEFQKKIASLDNITRWKYILKKQK